MDDITPNPKEEYFLGYAYNAFWDIFDEIKCEEFWEKSDYYRLSRFKDALLIYSEILEYKPTGSFIEYLKKSRPPREGEMSSEFVLFLRNLLIHFPFFTSWDQVWFRKSLINWSTEGRSIDRFLTKFSNTEEYKCRIWDPENKSFTFVAIRFPEKYDQDEFIELKHIAEERTSIKFVMHAMFMVIVSQIEVPTEVYPTDVGYKKF
jgi:hypothetical protein